MVTLIGMLAYKGSGPRPGHTLTPKYITIHNTANRGTVGGGGATRLDWHTMPCTPQGGRSD